jgi:hypothetical protein
MQGNEGYSRLYVKQKQEEVSWGIVFEKSLIGDFVLPAHQNMVLLQMSGSHPVSQMNVSLDFPRQDGCPLKVDEKLREVLP